MFLGTVKHSVAVKPLIGLFFGGNFALKDHPRKDKRKEMESIAPPDIIFGEILKYTEASFQISGNCLVGVPVAAGKASGIVRLIYHRNEGNMLQPGGLWLWKPGGFYPTEPLYCYA